jgi:hypothetical protein
MINRRVSIPYPVICSRYRGHSHAQPAWSDLSAVKEAWTQETNGKEEIK